ncbi:MAG: hypothetical protein GTO63_35000, partial [Anaerolineae bacterium]|nr:hypothetical protein [Anaerolineae bacterium]NIN99902.1 hypothetical protein [Anaerolineae bacterium]NIQ82672.1 hypothetical protein [Anaerolineae bacterium]
MGCPGSRVAWRRAWLDRCSGTRRRSPACRCTSLTDRRVSWLILDKDCGCSKLGYTQRVASRKRFDGIMLVLTRKEGEQI